MLTSERCAQARDKGRLTSALDTFRAVRLGRVAMAISIAGAVGCGVLSGVDDFYVADDSVRAPLRSDADVPNSGSDSDMSDARYLEAPVIIDAAPYDAGGAGYPNLAGSWSGSWNEDFTIVGGGATMDLRQDGGALFGTLEVLGGVCPRAGTLKGNFVSPNQTAGRFTSDDGLLILNLTSTLSADGTTLNGRFVSVGACLPGAFGTTQVTRPVSAVH
jgi:hypothetical protein